MQAHFSGTTQIRADRIGPWLAALKAIRLSTEEPGTIAIWREKYLELLNERRKTEQMLAEQARAITEIEPAAAEMVSGYRANIEQF